jgi:hypothetical protein
MASSLIRNIVITVLVAVLAGGFVIAARFYTGTVVPPVDAYLDGQRILFIHTEASDPGVAALLTSMKGSPVVVVPSLAKAPREMLAPVYVFKNGVAGEGPFKFQPDVFDGAPGAKSYSPLRELNLVTWKDERKARELKHADEVTKAAESGEITIDRPGVVINMPLLTWPGGQR